MGEYNGTVKQRTSNCLKRRMSFRVLSVTTNTLVAISCQFIKTDYPAPKNMVGQKTLVKLIFAP